MFRAFSHYFYIGSYIWPMKTRWIPGRFTTALLELKRVMINIFPPLLVSSPQLMPGRSQHFFVNTQSKTQKKSTKGPGESESMPKRAGLHGWHLAPPENPRCFHLKTPHFGKETKIWTKPSFLWGSKMFFPTWKASHSHYIVLVCHFLPLKPKSPPNLGPPRQSPTTNCPTAHDAHAASEKVFFKSLRSKYLWIIQGGQFTLW